MGYDSQTTHRDVLFVARWWYTHSHEDGTQYHFYKLNSEPSHPESPEHSRDLPGFLQVEMTLHAQIPKHRQSRVRGGNEETATLQHATMRSAGRLWQAKTYDL